MEDNSDSTSWVLVNDTDSAAETVTLISLSSSAESDEDSDGSIIILTDHTIGSDLEENTGQIKSLVATDDSSKPPNFHSEDMRNQVEDISGTQDGNHETDDSEWITDEEEINYLEDQLELVTRQQLKSSKNRETSRESVGIKITVGLLMSLLAVVSSQLFRGYSEYHIIDITNSNEEYLVPDVPTYTLIDHCIYQKFSKGQYTEQTIEKCVKKKLRKLNIEEMTEDSHAFLHLKKRIAELQDEFLTKEEADKMTYRSDKKEKNMERKKQKHNLKLKKETNNKFSSTSKTQLKVIEEKVKILLESEEFGKKFRKAVKNMDSNEEWYIKYNPVKETIEILNTSSMPIEPSTLTKNNQNLKGEWYFKLFGSSRAENRKKEQTKDEVSQWFFKRGRHRANKRNKAKWYFDYMSAREDTRYV